MIMNKKDLLELNSIKKDLLIELTFMYNLTKCFRMHIKELCKNEEKVKKLKVLDLVCDKMEDNFIDMENVYTELSNFIDRISCKK